MDSAKSVKLSKVLNGIIGVLLSIIIGLLSVVGYFLVDRDSGIKQDIKALELSLAAYEKKLERFSDLFAWYVDAAKDREQRIRHLEESCRQLGK